MQDTVFIFNVLNPGFFFSNPLTQSLTQTFLPSPIVLLLQTEHSVKCNTINTKNSTILLIVIPHFLIINQPFSTLGETIKHTSLF